MICGYKFEHTLCRPKGKNAGTGALRVFMNIAFHFTQSSSELSRCAAWQLRHLLSCAFGMHQERRKLVVGGSAAACCPQSAHAACLSAYPILMSTLNSIY